MASEAGERGKKVKLNYSYVHEEFEVITSHYHPGLETFGEARKCKECGSILTGTNATNLKAHLKSKHQERFLRVKSKFLSRGKCFVCSFINVFKV